MARDLHDVIGHNISLISVQAAVGLDLMDSDPDQARAALSAIRTVSREALDELRSMLAALRQAGEQAPTAPTPGLARLPELAELTRSVGRPVRIEVTGLARSLPAAIDLAAYRIVQESLTNVARHAGPGAATVRLGYRPGGVAVEVIDNGRGVPGALRAGHPVAARPRDAGRAALRQPRRRSPHRQRPPRARPSGPRPPGHPRPGGRARAARLDRPHVLRVGAPVTCGCGRPGR